MLHKNEELPSWYRQRRYIHFDEPLSFQKSEKLVTCPDEVARHAFWPLIRFKVDTLKIRQDKSTGKIITKEKQREISYAAHSDSQIFSYYCQMLSKAYENKLSTLKLSDSVLAFRSLGKNNIHFAKLAFDTIKAKGECTAIAFDITKFFDTLSHRLLKRRWKELLGVDELPPDHFAVFKALTKFSVTDRDDTFKALQVSVHNPRSGGKRRLCSPNEFRTLVRNAGLVNTNTKVFGIPQGTAISALLSNLYMIEFDVAALNFASCFGGTYMRYCDDMLFLMPPGMQAPTELFVAKEIEKLEVEINPEKTEICNFHTEGGRQFSDRPLQYLGFMYDGERVVIRSAAFAKFSNRMKRGVSLARQTMRRKNKLRTGRGAPERKLYLKKLLTRYSHLGKRNFLRYGHNAAVVMGSAAIRKQLRPLWSRLQDELKE